MLTPLDIHNKVFKKGLRGYDVDEVDDFLDEVIKDFETLYKENIEIKEELQQHKDSLARYEEIEETLQNTLILAEKTAEEHKRNAEKEAELIIKGAGQKAEALLQESYVETARINRKLDTLKMLEKQMMIKLKTYLKAQLEMIEEADLREEPLIIEENEEQNEHDNVECSGE